MVRRGVSHRGDEAVPRAEGSGEIGTPIGDHICTDVTGSTRSGWLSWSGFDDKPLKPGDDKDRGCGSCEEIIGDHGAAWTGPASMSQLVTSPLGPTLAM